MKPAKPATDEEYLRRAYLDLLGRIPSVQEARAFLADQGDGQAGEAGRVSAQARGLSQELRDPVDHPADRPGQPGTDGRSRVRSASWLRKQFAANRPWNEVVYDLVTATGSNKENGAVNYVLAHLEFGAVPLTSLTTRLFLGQQIQCTQCHDHPSNEWKQADFWGINAFFKGLKTEQKTAVNAHGTGSLRPHRAHRRADRRFVRFDKRNGLVGIAFPKFLDGRKISQGTDVIRRTELGKLIADPKNEDLARAFVNRMWGHFMGRGFVNPVDDFGPHNPPSHPELLDKLAQEFQDSWLRRQAPDPLDHGQPCLQRQQRARAKEREGRGPVQRHAASAHDARAALRLAADGDHRPQGRQRRPSDQKRDAWLRQFLFAFGNDEGEEATSFQGTIPQALMMMNGELMREAALRQAGQLPGRLHRAGAAHRPLARGSTWSTRSTSRP